MNHAYYADQQRSLSSTTQYPASSYQPYHSPSPLPSPSVPSASTSVSPSDAYYPADNAPQIAYAQQTYTGHAMVGSTSYPGSTAAHAGMQMSYADTRPASAPGGQHAGYAEHPHHAHAHHHSGRSPQAQSQSQAQAQAYGGYPSYAMNAPSPHLPRFTSTPAQSLHQSHQHPLYSHQQQQQSHPSHSHHSQQQQQQALLAYTPAPPSPGTERFPCERCDKTFSRAHDRKRHYESQHAARPVSHRCPYCRKEFSRADSMKRHVDNGCEKNPAYGGDA
ncbi:hypothetical protein BDW22DRAFT_1382629 [Trametopsis cervina]|nr:hypothetical protein BDW22DRAFT_1382629 [Trametopsis cervina]